MSVNSDQDHASLLPRRTSRPTATYGGVDDGPRPPAPGSTRSDRPPSSININTSPALLRQTSVRAMAVAESIIADRENRGESSERTVTKGRLPSMPSIMPQLPLVRSDSVDSIRADLECLQRLSMESQEGLSCSSGDNLTGKKTRRRVSLGHALGQIPAVLIAAVLNFMVGIPFGASYFPTELPLPGKEVLGLRSESSHARKFRRVLMVSGAAPQCFSSLQSWHSLFLRTNPSSTMALGCKW